ncbi:MAG: hypothetical protein QOE86_647 [Solirubrobacteraceae bacterium]|nr:hypothetical protein [Solirubrobacteraceae bacterium]
MTRTFTAEQRAAISDRSGSSLLAANAGSGKTAVMVERFVEAVLRDGVAVGAILALTFTEKAAGELRERLRARFTELGEHEHARAAEGAWVGTIHGFCARVLRAHPFAAGLDPRFSVLDEAATRRLRGTAWDRAVEAWAAAEGDPALDLLAASGPDLREMVETGYEERRSRGQRAPRLPIPAAVAPPDPAPVLAAAAAAGAVLAGGNGGVRLANGRAALAACVDVLGALAPGEIPIPTALDAAALGLGAKLLTEPACEAYREALATYRTAAAAHHARPALELVDRLLARYADECETLKAARAAVDFEDLQLAVRDLFAGDPALRARWSERFALLMIDEFQDTNRLQLDVLEMLERNTLFAVGDEFQSIYGFRHADVTIFRDRAKALPAERVRRLRANFRSSEELLDVLNGAFRPIFGEGFEPLVAGVQGPKAPPGHELRLFDPDRVNEQAGDPPVELLVTHTGGWEDVEDLGADLPGEKAWRRAEARLIAERLREEVDRGRRPGEIAVLVRAAASLRLIEQALEERGLATYVVGGRGYWSQEQVRDGLAYLGVLANPLDEEALYATLASPFAGVGADALVLAARAGAEAGGAWAALQAGGGWMADLPPKDRAALDRLVPLIAAERERAERLPAEVLLERAVAATGYDLAVLARPGGERRLANLRKLMRLSREFERAEGRDLRAFLAFAATQDLVTAREGEAALESEGLDAMRLMTVHRAKGLEFPVVCVADLGRFGPGGSPPLLLGADGRRVGIRLRALGAPVGVPALDHGALSAERARAEDEEERRLLYVAMTRARETLILSGGLDADRLPSPRPGGAPLAWIVPALLADPSRLAAEADFRADREWDGRPARLRVRVSRPGGGLLGPATARAAAAPAGTALPVPPTLAVGWVGSHPGIGPVPPALPTRLSYSSLGQYARCGYRWYLQRVLGLPEVEAPPMAGGDAGAPAEGLDPLVRGSLVHALLEDFDFARPRPPAAEAVLEVAGAWGIDPTPEQADDVARLVAAFADSPLCGRLAAARGVRREAPFAFPLEPGVRGMLLHGIVDVVAQEDGGALVVDYKTDWLGELAPEDLIARDYTGQRLVYALAALRDGAERVEVAHCFLELPQEPATATFTQADVPAVAERLVAEAERLLAGDFAPTPAPHRDLCATCPGRAALCSHPESRTLAP